MTEQVKGGQSTKTFYSSIAQNSQKPDTMMISFFYIVHVYNILAKFSANIEPQFVWDKHLEYAI